MDPKEQQNQNKEYIEWSEEAKKNMLELMQTLMEMEEEQKYMAQKKNVTQLVLPVKTASLSIFNDTQS